jgi:putative acetyltransferase
MRIRREEALDIPKIRNVHVTAFGSVAEADIVDLLRSDGLDIISLVAEDDGAVVGHIMFSPVQVAGARDLLAVALAPLAVIPHHQRTGIGSELVRAGFEECRNSGVTAVFVVGHPSYYPRFGFEVGSKRGFKCELDVSNEAFMVAELAAGALTGCSGTVQYHEAFRK